MATRTVAGDAEKTNTERKRRGQKVVFLRKEKKRKKALSFLFSFVFSFFPTADRSNRSATFLLFCFPFSEGNCFSFFHFCFL